MESGIVTRAERRRRTDWRVSGVVELTGRQDGPALIPRGDAATRARALAGYLSCVGVHVDGAALLGERAAFTGHRRRGDISVGGSCRLLPTGDGWAAVSCARPDDVLLLGALAGAELSTDPWPTVAAWLGEHSGAELAQRAELLGLAAWPVPGPVPAPGGADTPHLGAPFRPVAALGKGGLPPQDAHPRAIEGLLVVDFSALWAGPLCANLLGLGGARVVKVETPTRPDGARRGNSEFYRLLHAGHRSVVADPHSPDGHRLLHALVEAADIVIEASRPRALAGWGLGPESTDSTWVSITAAGRDSNRIGFGDDIAAGAGLVAWDEGAPVFVGDAIADPLAGLTAAAFALAASPGDLVEVDMSAVVAATLDAATAFTHATTADRESGPHHREVLGTAPASGADTDAVRRELGL